MSTLTDAVYRTAHAYPGGTVALAPRLGKASAALRQELLGSSNHKLGLETAAQIAELTGDYQALHVWCAMTGHVAVAVDGADRGGDVLGMLLDKQSASGDLASAISDALADGVVTANELATCAGKVAAAIARLNALLRELQAMHAAGQPAGHG